MPMSNDNPNMELQTKVNCPTCQKSVIWNEQSYYRPFCSKRCQQIDFGDWASENFSIPGAPQNQEHEHQENGDQEGRGQECAGRDFDGFSHLEQNPTKH